MFYWLAPNRSLYHALVFKYGLSIKFLNGYNLLNKNNKISISWNFNSIITKFSIQNLLLPSSKRWCSPFWNNIINCRNSHMTRAYILLYLNWNENFTLQTFSIHKSHNSIHLSNDVLFISTYYIISFFIIVT